MAKFYFHHVGKDGADRDFPKTVSKQIDFDFVRRYLDEPIEAQILNQLMEHFPSGAFNVWGVPDGAASVIKNLQQGDFVLLIGGTEQVEPGLTDGAIPFMAEVKVFPHESLSSLSEALWGDSGYPFIFFFQTEELNLTWLQFLSDMGYKSNYKPQGTFESVLDSRLSSFGGASGYASYIRENYV